MNFIADIYVFTFYSILPIILLLWSISLSISFFDFIPNAGEKIADKILGNNPIRIILAYLLLIIIILFSNFDMYALLGGNDIRFMSDGRYCYNVSASRFLGNTYTLPASIRKETNGFGKSKYYIEKIYFKNGGYLVFDEDDYITLNDYNYLIDQNGEEWTVELCNQRTSHKDVSESRAISFWRILLALLEFIPLSIYTFLRLIHITLQSTAKRQ